MKQFEDWCRENGYNPHTFEALYAYRDYIKSHGTGVRK